MLIFNELQNNSVKNYRTTTGQSFVLMVSISLVTCEPIVSDHLNGKIGQSLLRGGYLVN